MINLRRSKSLSRIAREWDAIATLRDDQISSGKDHSANFVLAPAILQMLPSASSLVDIGCGTGWLTAVAQRDAKVTVGVDPSHDSISLARIRHPGREVDYVSESIEVYSHTSRKFDLGISNMGPFSQHLEKS
jgi:2-polyprenyl-3-methyl-5-hydroxy-6-metoxy-1,4-benzoquinol methylase